MKVGALARRDIARRLAGEGLALRVEPYVVRLRSPVGRLADEILRVYPDYSLAPVDGFVDFDVHIDPVRGLRRWIRPQVDFRLGHDVPFDSLPREQAFAFFEWGLNWCVHAHLNEHLIIHAAVLERDGLAVVMPGEPGAGKSTLCAGLMLRGWRLLTDELALLRPDTGELDPIVRPVSLKNESIDIIADFAPDRVQFASRVRDTTKGAVAHLRPPPESVARSTERARPGWLIFPRFMYRHRARLWPIPKAHALIRAADDAFNYSVLGEVGFRVLVDLVETSDCYGFTYGNLDEAVRVFDTLEPPGGRQAKE